MPAKQHLRAPDLVDVQRMDRKCPERNTEVIYKRGCSRVNPEVIRNSNGIETFKKTFHSELGPEKKQQSIH